MEMKAYTLPETIERFALIPDWHQALRSLARLASPEAWQFRRPGPAGSEVEILAQYLRDVFRKNAEEYNGAANQYEEDCCIYIGDSFACFHTGLFTSAGKAIYMLFTAAAPGRGAGWTFDRYILEESAWFERMESPPLYPSVYFPAYAATYCPDWSIYIHFDKLYASGMLLEKLPGAHREPEAFRHHMIYVTDCGKGMARRIPFHMAPVAHENTLQYAMPLYLLGEGAPDCALILRPGANRVYVGKEVVSLQRAYHMARQVGPVQARWLKRLVQAVPSQVAI